MRYEGDPWDKAIGAFVAEKESITIAEVLETVPFSRRTEFFRQVADA